MSLYAVLVTYRREHMLDRMFEWASTLELEQLVVVDNDSSEEVKRIALSRDFGNRTYVAAPENVGPAGGIALGMKEILNVASDDDRIVLLDDDDPPRHDHTVERLMHFFDEMETIDPSTAGVGLTGSVFDFRSGKKIRPSDEELGQPLLVDSLGGNHFPIYRVGVLRGVGVFDPSLFFGLEELDFGLRVRRAGYSLYADGVFWQEDRGLFGRQGMTKKVQVGLAMADWRRYYSLRNLIWILRSNGHHVTAVKVTMVRGVGKPLASIARSPRLSVGHLRCNLRAIVDAWRGKLGRTVGPDDSARAPHELKPAKERAPRFISKRRAGE